ncbi:MAG: hypothetical protein ACLTSG_08935 [Lachnospiraceae bacterium]
MLASGNDAASALALHVADSLEDFAALMNEKAAALGMTESSFKNPHGLDEEGHYSTARDMAKARRLLHGEPGLCPDSGHRLPYDGGADLREP